MSATKRAQSPGKSRTPKATPPASVPLRGPRATKTLSGPTVPSAAIPPTALVSPFVTPTATPSTASMPAVVLPTPTPATASVSTAPPTATPATASVPTPPPATSSVPTAVPTLTPATASMPSAVPPTRSGLSAAAPTGAENPDDYVFEFPNLPKGSKATVDVRSIEGLHVTTLTANANGSVTYKAQPGKEFVFIARVNGRTVQRIGPEY